MEISLQLIELLRKDIGWLFALAVIFYEILWPYWTTKFQSKTKEIVSPLRDDISETQEKVDDIDAKVTELDENQIHQIQVTRAISKEMKGIDNERVDKYLVKNGVQVDEFILDKDERE